VDQDAILTGKRVLVVDDEADVREAVADVLARCAVDLAATHDEARAKLAANRYDVAIIDIMGVRGLELLEAFASTVPCIVLTAHALTPEHLERAKAHHALLFLPKDELGRLEEYVAKVTTARVLAPSPDDAEKGLWSWLLRRLDLSRHLRASEGPP